MPDTLPIMTIFAGPNGAGKSTIRELIKRERDLGVEVDADAIAKEKQLSDMKAGREVVRMVNECLRDKISFSIETTLSGKLIIQQILQAKEQGYLIRLLFVSLDSPLEHQTRVEQRVAGGGHAIPSVDIERRFYRSHENLQKIISMVDHADIYSNTTRCEMALQIERGKIVNQSSKQPAWTANILSQFEKHLQKSRRHNSGSVGTKASNRTRICTIRCQTSRAPTSKCKCVCGGKNHGTR